MPIPFSQTTIGVIVTGVASTVAGGFILAMLTNQGGQPSPSATSTPAVTQASVAGPVTARPVSTGGGELGVPPPPALGGSGPARTVTAALPSIVGSWTGNFSYLDGRMPVEFAVTFQSASPCYGRSQEPNTFVNATARTLYANLTCNAPNLASGQMVTITKQYDGTAGVSHDVTYTGRVASDGRSISGQWSDSGAVGGNFILRR